MELLNIDCMEYMAGLDDKVFDLAVIDPPYGIGENGSRNSNRSNLAEAKKYKPFYGKDYESPPQLFFSELKRISVNQVIFGANHFIEKIPGANSSCWLIWDKQNGNNDFADCEIAWTSFVCAIRIFHFRWAGMLQGDMKNKERRIHPTQKPVALYRWIYRNYAKPGQRILDTHLGSGSSAIAAHYFGAEFVGCEIDREYYDAAVRRFGQETRQNILPGF